MAEFYLLTDSRVYGLTEAAFALETKVGKQDNQAGLANRSCCIFKQSPGLIIRGFVIFTLSFFAFLSNFSLESALHGSYNPLVPESRQVVVYSRKGCHLCEVVKESLAKLSRRGGFTWQEVDVDSDGELRRQFNDEVPVVFIDGRKAFKYRMDEREFLRKLAS
jgi:glutaredoxin